MLRSQANGESPQDKADSNVGTCEAKKLKS
jgi:hypothetical protein